MQDWNPELYNRFRAYRAEPFVEILERLTLGGAERIVDLGCGSGENTLELALRSPQSRVLGVDSSRSMIEAARSLLSRSEPTLGERVSFSVGDIRDFHADGEYTVVFSNAALQWVAGHRGVFAALYRALAPGGRLVVQMPANERETTQMTILALCGEEPWRAMLSGINLPSRTVAAPDDYRAMLSELGFERIDCYYRTFEHPMRSTAEIVEWSRATVLRPLLGAIPAREHPRFLDALAARLASAYGTPGPLVFPFRRLFIWAARPAR